MFYLCDILQFIINRFNQGTFSQQDFILNTHQGVFHVILHFGDQLDAIKEQVLEKNLPDSTINLILLSLYSYFLDKYIFRLYLYGLRSEEY